MGNATGCLHWQDMNMDKKVQGQMQCPWTYQADDLPKGPSWRSPEPNALRHHRLTGHHAGDTFPEFHQQCEHISCGTRIKLCLQELLLSWRQRHETEAAGDSSILPQGGRFSIPEGFVV